MQIQSHNTNFNKPRDVSNFSATLTRAEEFYSNVIIDEDDKYWEKEGFTKDILGGIVTNLNKLKGFGVLYLAGVRKKATLCKMLTKYKNKYKSYFTNMKWLDKRKIIKEVMTKYKKSEIELRKREYLSHDIDELTNGIAKTDLITEISQNAEKNEATFIVTTFDDEIEIAFFFKNEGNGNLRIYKTLTGENMRHYAEIANSEMLSEIDSFPWSNSDNDFSDYEYQVF